MIYFAIEKESNKSVITIRKYLYLEKVEKIFPKIDSHKNSTF